MNSNQKIKNLIRKSDFFLNKSNKIQDLTIYQFLTKKITLPKTNHIYLYLIIDGSIRLHTIHGILDFKEGQYFISSIDTPKEAFILHFSNNNDCLTLSLKINIKEVLNILVELQPSFISKIINEKISIKKQQEADNNINLLIFKMLSAANDKTNDFLINHHKKEIIYDCLCGSYGKKFIQSIVQINQLENIYEINQWIKDNYKKEFSIENLAEQNHMSISNLHTKFKNAVGMSLVQCQKKLRLTEAKRLMLEENKNVTEVAIEVGYTSVSQFIREYKKMFGKTPKEDILYLQKNLKKEKTQSC